MRGMIHHPFDADHPLWATETAKRGGALGVGLQAMAFDPCGGQVIGIVRVQHGSVRDRDRQVLRPAAARVLNEFHALDPPRVIEPRAVGDAEIMPLAGDATASKITLNLSCVKMAA